MPFFGVNKIIYIYYGMGGMIMLCHLQAMLRSAEPGSVSREQSSQDRRTGEGDETQAGGGAGGTQAETAATRG